MGLLPKKTSIVILAGITFTAVVGSCGTAEDLTKDAVLDRAVGTWACQASGTDSSGTSFTIAEDGSFTFEGDGPEGDDDGVQWSVKDQVVRAEVGPADDLEWLEIRDLGDLDVKVAQVTMAWGDEDPSDDEQGDSGEVPLDVSLRGPDDVAIKATGPDAARFPSSPWTCRR